MTSQQIRQSPVLTLEGVTFGYHPRTPILANFTWNIQAGETWSILGPSGGGKTTLLYLLAGLRKPASGRVLFRGRSVTKPNPEVGLMLQTYGLLDWLTAERNVQLGLKIRHVPKQERHRIRAEWMERMQISHIAGQYPAQLSGGQRQRVALARVLALQTQVLLLDEPLSAVDELTRERLQLTLREITRELGVTMVMVTHSVEEAALLSQKILIFPEQAPLSQPLILSSPFDKYHLPQRHDPEFQAFCTQIRQTLGL
jgi:ABC-type nitrate/sulfonate/bicarbonate transport system ATPase subunit